MSTLTIAIVIVFCIGYFCIAIESVTKINKAAIALLMFVATWTLFMIDPASYIATAIGEMKAAAVSEVIEHHLGSTATTLFFLMGAMTIVELVDQNGGFNFVRDTLQTKSKRALLWRIAFMTFILSAILDNLTTSIVMIMILRKLVSDKTDRIIYAALVVISANSGGAFSPIGDVTTIMLWNKGVITAAGVIMEIFIPSLVSMVIPAYILSLSLKGNLEPQQEVTTLEESDGLSDTQRKTIFFLGVGGLIFVPIFKTITHLPPFVGILLVLGVLWTVTEIFYCSIHQESEDTANNTNTQKRVSKMLSRIDMDTILFFLGILMHRCALKHCRQRTPGGRLHGHVSRTGCWRHGRRRYLLAVAGLLCRCGRFNAHHRLRSRRSGHGSGEDYLRLVHEEDYVDSLCRLPGRHRLLLA